MRVIRTFGPSAREAERRLRQIEQRSGAAAARLQPAVQRILTAVQREGDTALRRYAARYDRLAPDAGLAVSRQEMAEAWKQTPLALRRAMQAAAKNIRQFAQWQMPKSWSRTAAGRTVGQRCLPLPSVGCYVPGGRYPLPSTLLMTALPARVAGVERIVVVSPRPARETLAAAHLAGVEEMYRIGGAQAVAALAYGTASIPRVEKIVGPGNLYVTTAKRLVAFDCAIDMMAGPTEIAIASESGDPAWIAADLVAQAEHDPEAMAILITANQALAQATTKGVVRQAAKNPIARQSLTVHGVIFLTRDHAETLAVTNRIAAEHLTVDDRHDLPHIRNAGSIFIGGSTPQSMGDYVSGPNHVLPTGRAARVRGGLSVYDFLRIVTTQEYSAAGLASLGEAAMTLAAAEGLVAHAASVAVRMESRKSGGKR